MSLSPEHFEVAVIGAGIAGLTCAALLANDGCRVALFESHDKPGGCAGFFQAGEFQFPVGATAVLGLEAGGLHQQTFELLGIASPNAAAIEGLQVVLPDRQIFMAHDSRRWRNERRRLGGHVRGQELFWRLQQCVADAGWRTLGRWPKLPIVTARDVHRNLGLLSPDLLKLGPAMTLTAGELMRVLGIHNDIAFRSLVDLQLIITAQGPAEQTPFLNAAAGLDLWRHGAFHVRGGTGTLAQKLAEACVARGAALHYGHRVVAVERQHDLFRLQTESGEFTASRVVANIPRENLSRLIKLSPKTELSLPRQQSRTGAQWGAVNLYCAVREEAIPAGLPLHIQVLLDYDWAAGDGKDCFLSLSWSGDTSQAPKGWRALNVSTHTHLHEWENLDTATYKETKRRWRDRLLQGVQSVLPNFEDSRKFVIVGTPKSWERYTQRRGVGGYPLTRWNANLLSLPNQVEEDLWVAGDTTFPGQGTVACALSGINVWREITHQER